MKLNKETLIPELIKDMEKVTGGTVTIHEVGQDMYRFSVDGVLKEGWVLKKGEGSKFRLVEIKE